MKRIVVSIMTILFISGYFTINYLFDTSTWDESDTQVLIILLMYFIDILLAISVFISNKHKNIPIAETLQYVILLGILLINIGSNLDVLTHIVSVSLIIWGIYINFVIYKLSKDDTINDSSRDDILVKQLSDKGLYYDDNFVKNIRILRVCKFLFILLFVVIVPIIDNVNRVGTINMLYVAGIIILLLGAILVYYRDRLFNIERPVKAYEYITDIITILAAYGFIYYKYAFVYETTNVIMFNDIFIFVIIGYPALMKDIIISKIYQITRL